jgi:hypothetical protein
LFRHTPYEILAKIAKALKIWDYPVFNRRLGDLGSLAILARI